MFEDPLIVNPATACRGQNRGDVEGISTCGHSNFSVKQSNKRRIGMLYVARAMCYLPLVVVLYCIFAFILIYCAGYSSLPLGCGVVRCVLVASCNLFMKFIF